MCYLIAAFRPRNPSFFSWQTRQLYPKFCFEDFELGVFQLLGSTQFFTPHRGFPLITLLLRMLHFLLFQDLKDQRFLNFLPNFLFHKFYLNLSFKFKFGPSLSLSCLMAFRFIFIQLIIHIIKATCFENTFSMAELEGKLP